MASLRAELLRVRRWPALWIATGAWLFLTALFGYVFNYVSYRTGDSNFMDERAATGQLLAGLLPAAVADVMVQGTPLFGGALMMVLGALLAGSGYAWGTWKSVFTQRPSRAAATTGSLLALTLVVAAVVVATLLMALLIATAIALVEGQRLEWPTVGSVAEGVGTAFLVLLTWAFFGFLLGTLARGPALAVGLGLVWSLVLEALLRGVGQLLEVVDAFTRVLPGTAAGSLVGAVSGGSFATGDGAPGVLDVLSGERAAWTLAAYLLLLPLASLLLVRYRDVG